MYRNRKKVSAAAVAAAIVGMSAAHAEGSAVLTEMTVTGTREQSLLAETPATVGVVKREDVAINRPMHPQQLLGQVPGVAIAVTNGEGHTTAIRQPFTTNPVYLYLEDGIPIRATGFFNHNALYEINLPQAGGVEVVKGPGTALYGSDAIGGIVNVLSRAPAAKSGGEASLEAGSFGTWRALGTLETGAAGFGAANGNLNVTHTDGWRSKTAYDRQSLNLRWDADVDQSSVFKTLFGYTKIDQETGASSALTYNDYLNNPTKNNFSIAFRKVEALRLSTTYDHEDGRRLVSVTPYVRNNNMDLNGSYNLSSDPRIEKTQVWSYGVMAKLRQDFDGPLRPRLIGGIDIDYSPASRTEDQLILTTTGAGADTNYAAYRVGGRIYDYDVTYQSTSPYVHGEISPTSALRLTGGMRYDNIRYDMTNHLAQGNLLANGKNYYQSADTATSYSRVSPKLGATFALTPSTSIYASLNEGFRAPSESQLFRGGNDSSAAKAQAKAQQALALKPIRARQAEIGLRGKLSDWSYSIAYYDLVKRDDIVSQKDPVTGGSVSMNAGKTEHKGIEVALGGPFAGQWRFDSALSYAKHRYVEWATATVNLSGNEMETAPRLMANARLTWQPSKTTLAQLEWVRIGAYWIEQTNSAAYGKYPGHSLLNLRGSVEVAKNFSLVGRLMNLTDKRYADSVSVNSSTAVYTPALPRSAYLGIEMKW